VGAGSARSFDLACCLSLQEQRRFGLTAESLLFDWSKRSNQEKTTPRPRPVCVVHTGFPAVLTKRRPLRNSHLHVLGHARFPLRFAPLLGAPEGPRVPSTRLPAWVSQGFVLQDLRGGTGAEPEPEPEPEPEARPQPEGKPQPERPASRCPRSGLRDDAPMSRRPCGPT